MLVGNKFKIESDALNVTLYQKEVNKNSGNTYWRPIAYFSTVKGALVHLVHLEVNGTGLKDLQRVVARLEELEELINSLDLAPELLQRARRQLNGVGYR